MRRGTIESELVARKDGKTYRVVLDYEIAPVYVAEEAAAVSDIFSEQLVHGQKIPDGDYTRRPHQFEGEKRVHVKGARMYPGWS